MTDTFITKVHIDKVRHLTDLIIPLSDTERKHLILTGKNGSGKTSVLEAMRDWLCEYTRHDLRCDESIKADGIWTYGGWKTQPSPPKGLNIYLNHEAETLHEFELQYFSSGHKLAVDLPESIENIVPHSSKDLIKYMVNQDYLRLAGKRDGDEAEPETIDKWFSDFQDKLRTVCENHELELKMYPKELNSRILLPGHESVDFTHLPDGYSSLLDIVTEIIMYIARTERAVFDMPGICLIDEVETHLHVSLQKKALPFLTTMFPNIQFIVTTHSPFVITSLADAVICDLERKEVFPPMPEYSWDSIVQYYYNTDLYSDKIKSDFSEYKTLVGKQNRSQEENTRLVELITYLGNIPSAAAPDLVCAFREIERNRRNRNGKN